LSTARRQRPRAVTPLAGSVAAGILDEGMSEAQWAARVEGWLRFYGWRYHHSPDNRPNARGKKQRVGDRGFPDYAATRNLAGNGPELAFLELKAERGRLGPGQAEWLAALGDVVRAVEDANSAALESYDADDSVPRLVVGTFRPSQARELEELLAGPRGRNVYVPGHRDVGDL
jgi:hypothetical protein